MEENLIKFNKIVTLNDDSFDVIFLATQKLMYCMKETNEKQKMRTEFFNLRLKYSEKNLFGKDLVLEWYAIS